MSEQFKVLHPLKYYRDYLSHNARPDGRAFDEYRSIVLNVGSISSADGSAIAKIGRTSVVCGIKAELCQPKPETADQGFFIPNVELPPLCSAKFKPGPPSEQAQIATQVVADIVKNAKCLDLKSLCLFPDKLAWCLYADIICLNLDGSLIDVCLIALIAALKSVTLPTVEYDPALDNKLVNINERKYLNILNIPTATTFMTFDNKILIDPTIDEEEVCEGLITVVTRDNELCSVHKPGGSTITDKELYNCIEVGKKRSKTIETLIESELKKTK